MENNRCNVKIKQISIKGSRVVLELLFNLVNANSVVCSYESASYLLTNVMKILMQCQNPLVENLLHFGVA